MMTFCAAMFHDVGKGIGEHGQTGAEMVRFQLKDELTPGEIGRGCTAGIRAQSSRAGHRKMGSVGTAFAGCGYY